MAKLADLKVNEMNCCQIDSILVLQNALFKKKEASFKHRQKQALHRTCSSELIETVMYLLITDYSSRLPELVYLSEMASKFKIQLTVGFCL